jgi:hypothetical protein
MKSELEMEAGGDSVDRFVGHFDPDDQSAFEKLADVYPREISERYPARFLRLWLNQCAHVDWPYRNEIHITLCLKHDEPLESKPKAGDAIAAFLDVFLPNVQDDPHPPENDHE